MTKIVQIAVAASEDGESLYALDDEGNIYEHTGKFFRYRTASYDRNAPPDPEGKHSMNKHFTYWKRVEMNTEPDISPEMLAAECKPPVLENEP